MKTKIMTVFATLLGAAAQAQTMGRALELVEANNLELAAMRQETDAAKAANAAERKMPALEAEAAYLWPGRKDVSVSQPLDWATLGGQRRRTAAAKDSLADIRYAAARKEVLLEAKLACIRLTHLNRLLRNRQERADLARQMAQAARKRLAAGDARQADVNNAELAYATARNQLARAQAEADETQARLTALNGGKPIEMTDTAYAPTPLPARFDDWYPLVEGRLPQLLTARAEASAARHRQAETRLEALPKLSVGFRGEFSGEEKYKGVAVGIGLPLWSGRANRRSAAKAAKAAQARQAACRETTRATLEAAFVKTQTLGRIASEQRMTLETTSNAALLRKAVLAGETPATEALMALSLHFEAAEEALTAERDYQEALASLTAATL